MSASGEGCSACRRDRTQHDLTMAFQPILDVQTRRIDSYEALVRGTQGESAADMLGVLTPETRYSFDQACRVKAISLAASLGIDRQLNINFMPNAVYEPLACIQMTLATARAHGFPLDRITFEITEDERAADLDHLSAIITEYRRHGFKIALDDFAAGYSGLLRLVELRPDIVKIDRGLICDCDQDTMRLAIIRHILAMGRDIGVKVVLEGVERRSELEALRDIGARFIQGFCFARPRLEAIARDADIAW